MPSRIVTFRVSENLMQDLKTLVIDRRKRSEKSQAYTLTDFIHEAIREKLNHMLRSRRLSRQRAKRQQAERQAIRYTILGPLPTALLIKRYFSMKGAV